MYEGSVSSVGTTVAAVYSVGDAGSVRPEIAAGSRSDDRATSTSVWISGDRGTDFQRPGLGTSPCEVSGIPILLQGMLKVVVAPVLACRMTTDAESPSSGMCGMIC